MKLSIFPLAFFWMAIPLQAQHPSSSATPSKNLPAKPELPSGQLLRPAASFSQWDVTFTYADEAKKDKVPSAADAARPRRTTTTKTGAIIHEELVNIASHVTDLWFNGGTQYRKSDKGPTWFQSDSDTAHGGGGALLDQNYQPLPANGFRNLDWITADNYVGTVPYADGRQCFVFTVGGSAKLDLSDPAQQDQRMAAADTIAYVDSDTRLPIFVRTHGDKRIYRFASPPTQMQVFPADLSEQIKKGDEARARLYQPAPRPY